LRSIASECSGFARFSRKSLQDGLVTLSIRCENAERFRPDRQKMRNVHEKQLYQRHPHMKVHQVFLEINSCHRGMTLLPSRDFPRILAANAATPAWELLLPGARSSLT
jgi:hypothetical protein